VLRSELALPGLHIAEVVARQAAMASLAADGCDAVALVCTEFPLLISPEVSPLPTLDSTDLLARAAVNTAVGDHLPAWRGDTPRLA
jgi:aspartate/glutamate racemase